MFSEAEATEEEEEEAEEGFLQVWLEGGLNQQRIGVFHLLSLKFHKPLRLNSLFFL